MRGRIPGLCKFAALLVLLLFVAPVHAQPPVADYGDAPDPTFPSLYASFGPRHLTTGDCYVGWTADAEGDANIPDLDYDDGAPLIFADYFAGKWTGWVYVPITIDQAGDPAMTRFLNVLLDCNSSGTWCDQAGEWIVRDFPLPKYYFIHYPGQTVWYCIGGFDWVNDYSGQHWLRVTLSEAPVSASGGIIGPTGWTGAIPADFSWGETEDWLLTWFYNPPLPPDPPGPPPHDPGNPWPPDPIPNCNKTATVYQNPPPTHRGHSGGFGLVVKNASPDHVIHIKEGPFMTDPEGSPIDVEIPSLESTYIQPGGSAQIGCGWEFPNPAPNATWCNWDVVVDPLGQDVLVVNVGNYKSGSSTQPSGGSFLELAGVPAVGGIGLAVLIVCVGLVALYFIVRRQRALAKT